MTKQLMNIGNHFKGLLYDDAAGAPITITDVTGDGSAFNGKTLVGNASGQFIPATVSGTIGGPGSSTDNAVARWDGAGGSDIQNSGVLIDDTDNVAIPGTITLGSSAHVLTNAAGLINGAKIQDLTIDPRAINQDGATAGQALAWDTGAGQFVPTTLSGTIGGSTGATDNRLLRADGAGGVTLQNSTILVNDSGNTSGMGTLACGAITTSGDLTSTDSSFQISGTGASVVLAHRPATGAAIIYNDPWPTDGTGNATLYHMRQTNTSGTRQSIWFKGDGTSTQAMSLNHDTGAAVIAGTLGCGAIASTGTSAFASVDVGGGFGSTGVTLSATGNVRANGYLQGQNGLYLGDGGLASTFIMEASTAAGYTKEFTYYDSTNRRVLHLVDASNNVSYKFYTGAGAGSLAYTPITMTYSNGLVTIGNNLQCNGQILFDDAHGMYIEPSGTTWNFGSSSLSNITAAFGNAGSGVMNMTLDGTASFNDLEVTSQAQLLGGIDVGAAGTVRGAIVVEHGGGGNTAGYTQYKSRNGTSWYTWVEDDGTFKISSGVPVNNSDGSVVGTQT